MTVEAMRAKLEGVYVAPRWIERVRQMPANQVIAIYHKFLAQGKFDVTLRKGKTKKSEPKYRQMTIFDYI